MSLIKLKIKAGAQEYPILIGNNILNKLKKIMKENVIYYNQSLVVVDENIPKKLIKKILFIILKPMKKIKIKKVLIIF